MPESTETRAAGPEVRALARLRVALLLIAVALAGWVWASIDELRRGAVALAIWNLTTVLAAGGAAVGTARRNAWARAAACGATAYLAIWSAFWARDGGPVLWTAGAASAAAFLLFASAGRALRAPPGPAPSWLPGASRAVVGLAALAFLGLGATCLGLGTYRVPSSAMEPTIPAGDRILASRYAYVNAPVGRFDVVVFRFPLNQSVRFVKRVVGLPEEQFFLDRGNVFTRPAGDPSARFRIARKPWDLQQAFWFRDVDGALDDAHWRPNAGTRADFEIRDGRLSTRQQGHARDIRFSCSNRTDELAGEVSIAFELELGGNGGAFFVELAGEPGRVRLELSADRMSVLEWRGDRRSLRSTLRAPRVDPERPHRVELAVYDGTAIALLDGVVQAELKFVEFHDDLDSAGAPPEIAFGAKDLLFTMRDLRLGRDIHHRPRTNALDGPDNAVTIPPGHYLMMGDNVLASHDSRAWTEVSFRLKDGRVLRCERRALTESYEGRERWARARGLSAIPDHYIQTDESGREQAFFDSDVVERRVQPFPFVHRKYVVAKVLWIWWPRLSPVP